jgi:hypothetical protein
MNQEIEQSVKDYLEAEHICFSATYVGTVEPKKFCDRGWENAKCFYHVCGIRNAFTRQQRFFDFYTGSAHVDKRKNPKRPTAASVLSSLLLDASTTEQSFEEWASAFGYSDDSIEARKTYDACVKTAHDLDALFTAEQIGHLKTLLQDY